jgi:uncharacterized protein (TIGR04255 family)
MTVRPVEHLRHAPITEAVLDVRVRAHSEINTSSFDALVTTLKGEYPLAQQRRRFFTSIELGPSQNRAAESRELGPDGYLLRSSDGLDAVQLQIDGFTLNRLKPYQTWSVWFPRFKKLWALYLDAANPSSVVRVGVRCINHFPVEQGMRLERYLAEPPRLPSELGSSLNGFLLRLEAAQENAPEQKLDMVVGLQVGPDGRSTQLLLDIEAFSVGDFEPSEVVELIDALHDLRDQAFFASVTEEALNQFR